MACLNAEKTVVLVDGICLDELHDYCLFCFQQRNIFPDDYKNLTSGKRDWGKFIRNVGRSLTIKMLSDGVKP